MAGYSASDQQRWVPEGPKRASRSAFARDRARVLHSAGWRRLAGRTQVVAAGQQDFPRTRMTHSLECAQVGRELGESLGCDPDLVETACLAHDLGHPPFGHNGELALDQVAAGIGGFEANAQTLRILTRLEAKTFGVTREDAVDPPEGAERSVGLNLTRAALDATAKYPWLRSARTPKFGVYEDEEAVFSWLRNEAPEGVLCFEAQVMDWADDVAYSVHDVEDGIQAGHIDLHDVRTTESADRVCAVACSEYAPGIEPDQLREAHARLLAQWPTNFSGTQRDHAALKNLTSSLIGQFTRAAERATRGAFPQSVLTRYRAHLLIPQEERAEVAVLKGFANLYVMQRPGVARAQERQRELIHDLAGLLWAGAPGALSPEYQEAWARSGDDRQRLRVVVDQVASLTDNSARARHRALKAIRA